MNKQNYLGGMFGTRLLPTPTPRIHRGCKAERNQCVLRGVAVRGSREGRKITILALKARKRSHFCLSGCLKSPQVGVQSFWSLQITEFHPSPCWGSAAFGNAQNCLEILSRKGKESGRRPCLPWFPEELDQVSSLQAGQSQWLSSIRSRRPASALPCASRSSSHLGYKEQLRGQPYSLNLSCRVSAGTVFKGSIQ